LPAATHGAVACHSATTGVPADARAYGGAPGKPGRGLNADRRLAQRQKGPAMIPPLDALTTPFSLSLLTAARGNASKRLVPDAHGKPMRDPAHRLGISTGRVEHVHVAGLPGLVDLLEHVPRKQALVQGIPIGSA